jgi:hypothetical protein
MSDPKRLLESSSHAAGPVRRALEAARAARPVEPLTREVWTALAAKLPLAPTGSGTPSSSDPSGGGLGASSASATGGVAGGASAAIGASAAPISTAIVIKAIGAGMALGVLVSAGAFAVTDSPSSAAPGANESSASRALESSADPPRAAARATGTPPQSAGDSRRPAGAAVAWESPRGPAEPERAEQAHSSAASGPALEMPARQNIEPAAAGPNEVPLPGKSSAAFAPADPPAAQARAGAGALRRSEGSDALEEGRLVASARQAIRGGSPQRGLELLEGANRRFAGGQLAQEREVLLIEALFATERTSLARERASQFLRDHPESAHATRVRAFLR